VDSDWRLESLAGCQICRAVHWTDEDVSSSVLLLLAMRCQWQPVADVAAASWQRHY